MKTNWEFESLNGDFVEDRKLIEKAFDDFVLDWENNSKYLESSEELKSVLDDYEYLIKKFDNCGTEGYYYWLKQELDKNDINTRSKFMQAEEFSIKQSNKILFFEITLSKISKEKQIEFLNDKNLFEYKNFLKNIFDNSKHILSVKEEKILSLKSSGSYSMWVKMVESLLSKELRVVDGKEMTYPELINTMRSTKKDIRDLANKEFENIMRKYEDIAEVELNAVLENIKVDNELRGFNRFDESRIKKDGIDFEFIDSILEAIKDKFSISKRYYSLIAKLIGQEKIGYHERNVETGKINKKYSYEEGITMVKKVFSNLDNEFLDIFNNMIEEGRLDAFPKKGKNGGAFCVHWRKNDPVYVLLNHTGDMRDVTTLAHEMGHAINDSIMTQKENALNYETPKATAEVASIFMEDFVFEEILKTANEEEKFCLLIKKIGEEISSIHRQVSLYLFELEIHKIYKEEGYLSKTRIGEIFVKNMSNYLGENVTMKNANLWWIYWGHIRMYFYVYSYASGALISKAMQSKYRKDNSFMKYIKEFLRTGGSSTPREIFEKMGIKINKEFFIDGLLEIEKNLDKAEKLAKDLGKI
ncbi:M3 family oligoendopeptidase [Candidatus Pacearchaeota archaeon]|nr:M3 family oligoendopeptidase [Candidatus Pacearchaeota archaeon]